MKKLVIAFTSCLLLSACEKVEKFCDSKDVLEVLHNKLVEGLNFTIGVKDYYDGKKAKIDLNEPRETGKSSDMTRCSAMLTLTQYVDPETGRRYQTPQIQTLPIPYSFKAIDAMITMVKIAQ